MGKERIVDEYGCEITKEEAEEMDKIAHKTLDAVYGEPKKKPGRPKKSDSAKLHEDSLGQYLEEKNEPQKSPGGSSQLKGAPSGSSRQIIPIEVMDALEEKMQTYERTIKSYEDDITQIQKQIKQIESKYKVLSNFVKGATDGNKQEGQAAHDPF